jgi:hypothetical protein
MVTYTTLAIAIVIALLIGAFSGASAMAYACMRSDDDVLDGDAP